VRNVGTGDYCVQAAPGINPGSDPALLTVEYARSSGSSLAAFWNRADNSACDADEYEVMTFDFSGVPTDGVAFLIAIP
jgi:hypothetical protein